MVCTHRDDWWGGSSAFNVDHTLASHRNRDAGLTVNRSAHPISRADEWSEVARPVLQRSKAPAATHFSYSARALSGGCGRFWQF